MAKFSERFNVIDNGGDPIECHQLGGKGYINLTAESYPKHDLKVWELIENKQYDDARKLNDSVNEPLRKLSEIIDARSGGQGRVKKGMMALMGQSCGSSRPPSKPLNESDFNQLRETLLSFGWPVKLTAKEALSATT
jgi:dihydrodipicolinate synthase/N-acetylneuraminate lyase